MIRVKLFLMASIFGVGLTFFGSSQTLEGQVPLIAGPQDSGNGDFIYNVNGQAIGLDGAAIVEAPARHRALVSQLNTGRGIAFPGWVLTRVQYDGGNSAIGTDGTFGFAPGSAGTIDSGQVFANSGTVSLTSEVISESINAGDTLNLSYLLGSDTNGGTESANATVSLIFDPGLPTESIEILPQVTRTGIDSMNGFAANQVDESFPVVGNFSSFRVVVEFVAGDGVGERGLVDSVRLSMAPASGGPDVALIDGAKEAGNGDFAYDVEGEADAVIISNLVEAVERHRVLISEPNDGRGLILPGWRFIRTQYDGGNSALGTDGTFGFAPGSAGSIASGQAFVNSGTISVVSDSIVETINAGDTIDLSYLLGSDTGGGTADANSTVSLIFDAGLPTESVVALPTVTRTGVDSAGSFAGNEVVESIVVTSGFSTVTAVFEIVGGNNVSERALLDEVRMSLVPGTNGSIPPTGLQVFRGVSVAGGLAEILESDDQSANYNPGFVLNSTEAPVWLITDGVVSGTPTSLSFVRESNAGTPGLSATMEAFNWNSNAFEEIDVRSESFNADMVVTLSLDSGITDYVEAGTGAVRSRVGWRQSGFVINFPWEIRVDQMVWTAN